MALDEYSVVAVAITKMDSKLEKLQDEVADIGKVLTKQDVLLEKIVNLESNTTENNKRIHHRIDEVEKRVNEMNDFHHEDGCPVHRQFVAQKNEQLKRIDEKASNFDERIKTLEGKGSKRMDVVINKVIEWSVVFIIGAILLKFGVK